MREVPLVNGNGVALVDDDDWDLVANYIWRRNTRYARTHLPMVNGKRIEMQMHRMILGISKALIVDHIDGNGLNNQRSNLRIATRAQNLANSGRPRTNKTGFKGVQRQGNRWIAVISSKGKTYRLGSFDNPVEAAKAYDEAAFKLYGEFYIPNLPAA